MMRYLGIHWNMDYCGQTIMDMTTEKLEAALARIQTFPCTADIRKTALDQKISACISLSQNYPSKLLYYTVVRVR